jgi:hypothetical protein
MSTRHSHRRVDEAQLYETTELPFKQGRHDAQDLAELVIAFSKHRGSTLSEIQESALHSFHTETKYDLRDHITIPISAVIPAYFVLFDDLFFFGSLRDRCNLAIDREESLDVGRRGQMIGTEVKVKKKVFGLVERTVGEQRCVIVLNSHWAEFLGRHAMLKGYVETLLHEMCHAFLELWTCGHSGCVDGFDKLGKTRHGWIWQDVALAIENVVRDKHFLNLDLCLNREMSLALEVVTMDEFVRRKDLERWGMRHRDVADAIDIVLKRQQEGDDCSIVLDKGNDTRRTAGSGTLVKGMEILGGMFFD